MHFSVAATTPLFQFLLSSNEPYIQYLLPELFSRSAESVPSVTSLIRPNYTKRASKNTVTFGADLRGGWAGAYHSSHSRVFTSPLQPLVKGVK